MVIVEAGWGRFSDEKVEDAIFGTDGLTRVETPHGPHGDADRLRTEEVLSQVDPKLGEKTKAQAALVEERLDSNPALRATITAQRANMERHQPSYRDAALARVSLAAI